MQAVTDIFCDESMNMYSAAYWPMRAVHTKAKIWSFELFVKYSLMRWVKRYESDPLPLSLKSRTKKRWFASHSAAKPAWPWDQMNVSDQIALRALLGDRTEADLDFWTLGEFGCLFSLSMEAPLARWSSFLRSAASQGHRIKLRQATCRPLTQQLMGIRNFLQSLWKYTKAFCLSWKRKRDKKRSSMMWNDSIAAVFACLLFVL